MISERTVVESATGLHTVCTENVSIDARNVMDVIFVYTANVKTYVDCVEVRRFAHTVKGKVIASSAADQLSAHTEK